MQIVDHEKLKSVFADAIELRPAERASFIDEACGDDDVLRSEVISLLNAADSDHNLIEDNIFELSKQISDSPAEMTGIQFGNYLTWTFFTAMGVTELAHFIFPFFTKEPYGYFPGMASVFFLAPVAWWGIYRLSRKTSNHKP